MCLKEAFLPDTEISPIWHWEAKATSICVTNSLYTHKYTSTMEITLNPHIAPKGVWEKVITGYFFTQLCHYLSQLVVALLNNLKEQSFHLCVFLL